MRLFFTSGDSTGGTYNIKTKTLLDQRYYHILPPALSTSRLRLGSAWHPFFTYHYKRPADERVHHQSHVGVAGDQEKIRKEGFSLLDMKNYLLSIGMHSNGYHESLAIRN